MYFFLMFNLLFHFMYWDFSYISYVYFIGTFLTLAVILNAIDPILNYEECKKIFDQLMVLDSKRKNYYKDLCARWHLEYCLESDQSIIEKGTFVLENQNNENIELPIIYHLQYWSA
mgnify:CR=1 FL=1